MRMITPIPLPDETLASLLARLCRLNGIIDFRDVAALYFGEPTYASFIDAPIDLPEFCRRTGHAYGDPEEVLEHLTWFGAQVRLGELDASKLMEMECGARKPLLGELTFSGFAALGYCTTCRLQDTNRYGVSYWHRIHQVPVVRVCPQHGDLIVRVGIKRARLHQTFPLPGDFEPGGREVFPESAGRVWNWRNIAGVVCDVLAARTRFDREIINEALWDGVRAKEMVTPNGVLRKSEIVDFLLAYLGGAGNNETASRTVSLSDRIVRSLTEPAKGIAFGRSVLLEWVFGSWAAFEEKCKWATVFGVSHKVPTQKAGKVLLFTNAEQRKHHRKICADYMANHPNCSRLEFTRAEYRTFRWLLHNDRAWLDSQLPVPLKVIRQLSLF